MEKEPHWIGHRTAERHQTENDYLYRDLNNQSLAIMLGVTAFHPAGSLFDGANLWEVDRFVEGLEAGSDPTAEKCRARLDMIRKLFKSGDLMACLPHADTINAEMRARRNLEAAQQRIEVVEAALAAVSAQRRFSRDATAADDEANELRSASTGAKWTAAATNGGATELTPEPLRSPAIADAFAGLNGWDRARWAKALGDGRTKWLTDARRRRSLATLPDGLRMFCNGFISASMPHTLRAISKRWLMTWSSSRMVFSARPVALRSSRYFAKSAPRKLARVRCDRWLSIQRRIRRVS